MAGKGPPPLNSCARAGAWVQRLSTTQEKIHIDPYTSPWTVSCPPQVVEYADRGSLQEAIAARRFSAPAPGAAAGPAASAAAAAGIVDASGRDLLAIYLSLLDIAQGGAYLHSLGVGQLCGASAGCAAERAAAVGACCCMLSPMAGHARTAWGATAVRPEVLALMPWQRCCSAGARAGCKRLCEALGHTYDPLTAPASACRCRSCTGT